MPAKPKKNPDRTATSTDIGDALDVNERTIRRWVADGLPHDRGRDGLRFDLDEVNRWMRDTGRRTTPGRLPKPKPENPENDKDYWLARKYKNQCLREEGELVDVVTVSRFLAEALIVFRSQLLNLPATVVPRLHGMTPAEQEVAVREQIDAALRQICDTFGTFDNDPAATLSSD